MKERDWVMEKLVEFFPEAGGNGDMIPCWGCLKLIVDRGADRQWCGDKCMKEWEEKHG